LQLCFRRVSNKPASPRLTRIFDDFQPHCAIVRRNPGTLLKLDFGNAGR
jgi:hypothetical protein